MNRPLPRDIEIASVWGTAIGFAILVVAYHQHEVGVWLAGVIQTIGGDHLPRPLACLAGTLRGSGSCY